jgi:hypothetical protein
MLQLLIHLIALVAFLYASLGFGGPTGYLLVMSQFNFTPEEMASTHGAVSDHFCIGDCIFFLLQGRPSSRGITDKVLAYFNPGHFSGRFFSHPG